MQALFSHSFELDMPLADAIYLFTPEGEIAWVPGWDPDFIHPKSGETCEEMVFVTTQDDHATYWTCTHWRPQSGEASYVRVTPHLHFVFVNVRCHAIASHRTLVAVSYKYSPLSKAGREEISMMTPTDFEASIAEWPVLISNQQERAG